jgi:hypothetical protein
MNRIQTVLTALLSTLACIVLLGVLAHFAHIQRSCAVETFPRDYTAEDITSQARYGITLDNTGPKWAVKKCSYYVSNDTTETMWRVR